MPDLARLLIAIVCCNLAACAGPALMPDAPMQCNDCDAWNAPQVPFHIFGNTYYVGTAGISSILVATNAGLILFDGGLPQSAPLIADNIRSLGFDPRDIRAIGLSHAHFDHVGGIAALRRYSQAIVVTSKPALRPVREGMLSADDPQFGPDNPRAAFPAIPEAVAIDDDTLFRIGDVEVRGIYTPGHTPGGMTWTWRTCEATRCLDFVYVDSFSPVAADGYRFSDGLGEALRNSIGRVAKLDCDIMFANHPFSFGMQEKLDRGRAAFVDDQSCRRHAQARLAGLQRRLQRESERP